MHSMMIFWFIIFYLVISSKYNFMFLSDCGGKICKNGGTMNLGSCSCECAYPFAGEDCGKGEITSAVLTII